MSAQRTPLRAWVADLLTLSNGVFGFLAVLTWSVELGPLSGIEDQAVAAAYIGLGMVADGLDGIVARRWGSTGLGNALDSMSDFLTFCVAPAVFLLEVTQAPRGTLLAAVTATVAVAFIVAGMLRLARHQNGGAGGDHFRGLPAPWSGATLVVIMLLDPGTPAVLASAVLLAALNVSHIPYPKTRGRLTGIALVIMAAAVAVIAALLVIGPTAGPAVWVGVAVAVTMIVVGPAVARKLG